MLVTTCSGGCYNLPRTGVSCNTLTHLISFNIRFHKYVTSKTNYYDVYIFALNITRHCGTMKVSNGQYIYWIHCLNSWYPHPPHPLPISFKNRVDNKWKMIWATYKKANEWSCKCPLYASVSVIFPSAEMQDLVASSLQCACSP